MATETKRNSAGRSPGKGAKKAAPKKGVKKRSTPGKSAAKKRSAPKKSAAKSAAGKGSGGKNKLGVKNSLVNNINARKKKGKARPKKKSTISRKSYKQMQNKWK